MKFTIDTDLTPLEAGVEHSRDNWERPLADKLNDAFDFLNELDHKGFMKLDFNSISQEFNLDYEECRDLSTAEINSIYKRLKNYLNNES